MDKMNKAALLCSQRLSCYFYCLFVAAGFRGYQYLCGNVFAFHKKKFSIS